MTKSDISGIAPLFIVNNVPAALAFYRDRLGFDITFQGPAGLRGFENADSSWDRRCRAGGLKINSPKPCIQIYEEPIISP